MVASYKSPLKACKAVVNEAYKLWLQYDVRTDDITMIAIYLEDTGGLARAHAEAMAAAVAAEEKTTPPGSLRSSMTLRRSSLVLREQRRKSSSLLEDHAKGIALGVTSSSKSKDATQEDARPVRRVMTKEREGRHLIVSKDANAMDQAAGDRIQLCR